jgi:hypothetical protein
MLPLYVVVITVLIELNEILSKNKKYIGY